MKRKKMEHLNDKVFGELSTEEIQTVSGGRVAKPSQLVTYAFTPDTSRGAGVENPNVIDISYDADSL